MLPSLLLVASAAYVAAPVRQPPSACDVYVTASMRSAEDDAAAHTATVVVGSIGEAQSAVRSMIATRGDSTAARDLLVCLGAGSHGVEPGSEGALRFTHEDTPAGNGRVVWRGMGSKADPTKVTGGVQVTGWQKATLEGSSVYKATVPAEAATLTSVRQLWVDETRANRTSVETAVNCTSGCVTPDGAKGIACAPGAAAPHACPSTAPMCVGFQNNVKWGKCEHCDCKSENALPLFSPWMVNGSTGPAAVGFTTSAPLPDIWAKAKPNTVEFVWPIVIQNWIEPRCTVASIVGTNVTLASPCSLHLFTRHAGKLPPAPVRIEAAPPTHALKPGEFYHDSTDGTLYYNLADGQTESQLEASSWIAAKEVLLDYTATTKHTWDNVQFSYSTWLQPNSDDGYVDNQATVYLCTAGSKGCNLGTSAEPLGAVRVTGAKDLAFTGCEFSHHGSPYALSVLGSSKAVEVSSCTFKDLSGGFLKLGSVGKDNTNPDESSWDEGFSVTHNVAHTQAIEYGGAPGYFGGWIAHSTISHNTVSDAGYSGFSQGWGWGGTHAPGYGNVTLSYNRIFNVMTKMNDGGGIYVNGYTNDKWTNVMSHNWVDHDMHVFAVYYLDNGASHWHVTQNVATNSTNQWAYFMTPGTGVPSNAAHNNTLDHLWYQNDAKPNNGCEKYGCIVDEATVFNIPAGEPLPAPALAIMAAAGANPSAGRSH